MTILPPVLLHLIINFRPLETLLLMDGSVVSNGRKHCFHRVESGAFD